jgi:hypothetical protein
MTPTRTVSTLCAADPVSDDAADVPQEATNSVPTAATAVRNDGRRTRARPAGRAEDPRPPEGDVLINSWPFEMARGAGGHGAAHRRYRPGRAW